MIPIQNLDQGSKLAIEIAQKLAKEHNHSTFGPPHLLMALLNNRVGITSFLSLMDKDLTYLRGWAQYRIDEYKSLGLPQDEPEADEKALNVMNVSKAFMLMFNQKRISALCILAAITRPEVGFPKGQIGSLRLTEDELVEAVLNDTSIERALQSEETPTGTPCHQENPTLPLIPKPFSNFVLIK